MCNTNVNGFQNAIKKIYINQQQYLNCLHLNSDENWSFVLVYLYFYVATLQTRTFSFIILEQFMRSFPSTIFALVVIWLWVLPLQTYFAYNVVDNVISARNLSRIYSSLGTHNLLSLRIYMVLWYYFFFISFNGNVLKFMFDLSGIK